MDEMGSDYWTISLCLILLGTMVFSILPAFGEDKIYDVIVVGAGISGLSAADALTQSGLDVVVLEAKNRTGGRIWTDNTTGVPLDKGASWIHGIKYNPIFVLKEKYKIDTIPTLPDDDPASHVYYDYNGKKLNETQQKEMDDNFEDFTDYINKTYAYHSTYPSKKLVLDQFVNYNLPENSLVITTKGAKSLEDGLNDYYNTTEELEDDKKYRQVADYYFENTWAADISEISLRHYDMGKEEYNGTEVIFPEGYSQIVKNISGKLDIRTNHVVNKIDYNSKIISVYVDGNKTFRANYVLVTLPLGVLKDSVVASPSLLKSDKGLVKFDPPLEEKKIQSIKNVGMGIMNKAYLIFDEHKPIFWHDDEDIQFISIMNEDGKWTFFMNLYKSLGKPILLAFNSGSAGKELEQLDFHSRELAERCGDKSDSARDSFKNLVNLDNLYNRPLEELDSVDQQKYEDVVGCLAMDSLRRIYGNNIPEPSKTVVTRWASDPFIRGSYSFPAVDSTPTDFKNIAESVKGRLFFAGEVTEPDYYGTVHGAYLSGIRAAHEINFSYKWDTIHEKEMFVIIGLSVALAAAWVHVLRWRAKMRIALDVLNRNRKIVWRYTILIAVSVVFVVIVYYWLEFSVGAIPDVFDYFRDWDNQCDKLSTLNDTMQYMQLSPEDKAVYYEQFQECITHEFKRG